MPSRTATTKRNVPALTAPPSAKTPPAPFCITRNSSPFALTEMLKECAALFSLCTCVLNSTICAEPCARNVAQSCVSATSVVIVQMSREANKRNSGSGVTVTVSPFSPPAPGDNSAPVNDNVTVTLAASVPGCSSSTMMFAVTTPPKEADAVTAPPTPTPTCATCSAPSGAGYVCALKEYAPTPPETDNTPKLTKPVGAAVKRLSADANNGAGLSTTALMTADARELSASSTKTVSCETPASGAPANTIALPAMENASGATGSE